MQVRWNRNGKFVSVSQLLGLALCSLFGSVSGPFTVPGLIVSLWGRKKKNKKKKKEDKKSLLLTLNPLSQFCWYFWMSQEEGGWALLSYLPMVL